MKILVIGASPKPNRYSNIAIRKLRAYGHEVIALAKRAGKVDDVIIRTEFPLEEKIHTVTLYIGPQRQAEYDGLLKGLKPERVIFNPGTENDLFAKELSSAGIEVIEACTLVMLDTDKF